MRSCVLVPFFLLEVALGQTPPQKSTTVAATDQLRARAILDSSLQDKNPEIRKFAVQSLGLIGPGDPYLLQLETMLADKDVEVRLAAITSLVDMKNKRTVPVLQQALNSDVSEVSFAAAKALWALNERDGRDALVAILSREEKASSGFIARQKRDMLRMMHTPKTTFLFILKEGAGFAPVPGIGAGVSSVQGILTDPSTSGRATAALLLSTDHSPEVQRALQDALADPDWSVRAAAVHAIALRNDPALKATLLPLFNDKKDAVRVRAAAGYLRLAAIPPAPAPPARKRAPKKQPPSTAAGRN
jgi:HEAT repeat protein